MKSLKELPNISVKLEDKLSKAGIITIDDLLEAGVKESFFRIRQVDYSACINMLYALEGAIQGIRWHYLDPFIKIELNEFYDTMNAVELR